MRFETHLFNLMRAEVRLWALQGQLAAQDAAARENAEEISRIIHAQILGKAAEALPILQRTPNQPFTLLLVHQLEAYPYEWQEEGSEELLPGLRKLADPATGKPATGEGGPQASASEQPATTASGSFPPPRRCPNRRFPAALRPVRRSAWTHVTHCPMGLVAHGANRGDHTRIAQPRQGRKKVAHGVSRGDVVR